MSLHDPRYVVGSVTGFKIDPTTGSSSQNNKPPTPIFYVFDSWVCYRQVLETWHEERANELAAKLNLRENWTPIDEAAAGLGLTRSGLYDRRLRANVPVQKMFGRSYITREDMEVLSAMNGRARRGS